MYLSLALLLHSYVLDSVIETNINCAFDPLVVEEYYYCEY